MFSFVLNLRTHQEHRCHFLYPSLIEWDQYYSVRVMWLLVLLGIFHGLSHVFHSTFYCFVQVLWCLLISFPARSYIFHTFVLSLFLGTTIPLIRWVHIPLQIGRWRKILNQDSLLTPWHNAACHMLLLFMMPIIDLAMLFLGRCVKKLTKIAQGTLSLAEYQDLASGMKC